jgi:dihydrofolate reductase
MSIIGIVAVAQNLAIGKEGKLPWHYKSDLKFFKQTTVENAIVMGWNTWASIGKPLPNRLNIVLSRDKIIESQTSVLLMRNRAEVLALKNYLNCDLCIIGGASVYKLFEVDIEKWIVTEIPQIVEDADTFLSADTFQNFKISETQSLEDNLKVKFYERNQ